MRSIKRRGLKAFLVAAIALTLFMHRDLWLQDADSPEVLNKSRDDLLLEEKTISVEDDGKDYGERKEGGESEEADGAEEGDAEEEDELEEKEEYVEEEEDEEYPMEEVELLEYSEDEIEGIKGKEGDREELEAEKENKSGKDMAEQATNKGEEKENKGNAKEEEEREQNAKEELLKKEDNQNDLENEDDEKDTKVEKGNENELIKVAKANEEKEDIENVSKIEIEVVNNEEKLLKESLKNIAKVVREGIKRKAKVVKEGIEKEEKIVKEGIEKEEKIVKEGIEKEEKIVKEGIEKEEKVEERKKELAKVEDLKNKNQVCLPKQHIMFLKTHKCASSTILNILLRYGFNRNLTFALPEKLNYLGEGKHFQASMMPKSLMPDSGKIDIFTIHTRLNTPEVSKILHNDTVWVTIVREPGLLYDSLYQFFHLKEFYNMTLSSFTKIPIKQLMLLPRMRGRIGRNQIFFDLGYSEKIPMSKVQPAIDSLDSKFNLVMVSEHFDESLILLRHLLCWSLDDVVYFTKNARRKEVKRNLNPKLMSVLQELNSADVVLYDHFLTKHLKAVYDFGVEKMAEEVAALRSLRMKYFEDCGAQEVKSQDPRVEYRQSYRLTNEYIISKISDMNCWMLALSEQPFVEITRKHQAELISKPLSS